MHVFAAYFIAVAIYMPSVFGQGSSDGQNCTGLVLPSAPPVVSNKTDEAGCFVISCAYAKEEDAGMPKAALLWQLPDGNEETDPDYSQCDNYWLGGNYTCCPILSPKCSDVKTDGLCATLSVTGHGDRIPSKKAYDPTLAIVVGVIIAVLIIVAIAVAVILMMKRRGKKQGGREIKQEYKQAATNEPVA